MKYSCDNCPTAADCRQAFGRYWNEKSRDGTGCDHRFPGYGIKPAAPVAAPAKAKVRLPYQEEFQ